MVSKESISLLTITMIPLYYIILSPYKSMLINYCVIYTAITLKMTKFSNLKINNNKFKPFIISF